MSSLPYHSIVLLSGGLDSAYALIKAIRDHAQPMAITFDYGHQSARQEISAASQICQRYKINHEVISLPFFKGLVCHPLFEQNVTLPCLKTPDLDNKKLTDQSAQAVWIPNRNGLFINLAATMAEARKISEIFVGFNAEEGVTFPDNTREFLDAINNSLALSTWNHVKVLAPAVSLTKTQIVRELLELDFPLPMLWSCYTGQEKMCGQCESCLRLMRAIEENGIGGKGKNCFNCFN